VEWVIATGETDSLVNETRGFTHVLRSKGIPVHCEVWPGVFGHDWPFWKEHLRRFLP
jgi:esterase/lipase superfamily enzyme